MDSALWGTYHGAASIPSSGQPRASLEGTVTGGTGLFAGASGSFSGTGMGGFAGDGVFSVTLRATVSTRDGGSLDVRAQTEGNVDIDLHHDRTAADGAGRHGQRQGPGQRHRPP